MWWRRRRIWKRYAFFRGWCGKWLWYNGNGVSGCTRYCNGVDDNCDGVVTKTVLLMHWHGISTPMEMVLEISLLLLSLTASTVGRRWSWLWWWEWSQFIQIRLKSVMIWSTIIVMDSSMILMSDVCLWLWIEIPSDQVNLDIDHYLGQPTQSVDIYIYIPSGVRIYSSTPSLPALNTGNLPSGSTITLLRRGDSWAWWWWRILNMGTDKRGATRFGRAWI